MTIRNAVSVVATIAIFICPYHPASAAVQPAADGAMSVNASWETGQSSTWYIELQRAGADWIQMGVDQENDADIREGILILNWGFNHQAADGSFGNTAGGLTGAAYHSTSIFVEAAARATLQLQRYSPVTYSANKTYYNQVVAGYTTKLEAAAKWMARSDIAALGQQQDYPYTHRRYLNAAALAETGALSGDTALNDAATAFVLDGLSLQQPNGVNPEVGGYDVSYQAAGVLYAERYYPYCADANLRTSLRQMMTLALNWEMPRVDVNGNVDPTGSTRVGIELNRDGTVKQVNVTEIDLAFSWGYHYTKLGVFQVAANRIENNGLQILTSPMAADGSIGANTTWETGGASTWSIALQRVGADLVETGIACENDAAIRQGILVLNWGLTQQLSDGSFGTTSSPFAGGAQFLEAVARVASELSVYKPRTYSANLTYYHNLAAVYVGDSHAGALWLSGYAAKGNRGIATSTSHQFYLADCFAIVGKVSGDPTITALGAPYMTTALSLQQTNGMDPEAGLADVNCQAMGTICEERYIALNVEPLRKSAFLTSVTNGLKWEMTNVGLDGTIHGTSSPAVKSILTAFQLGYTVTANRRFLVAANRIAANMSQ